MPTRPRASQSRFQPLDRLHASSAGPRHLGFSRPGRNGAELDLTVLAPDLFRLVIRRPGTRIDPSWAVVNTPWPDTEVTVRRRGARVTVETPAAAFHLDLDSGAWGVVDPFGLTVFEAPAGGTGFEGRAARVTLRLAPREALFGLGESTGPLDQRGRSRVFWNVDALQHASSLHPGLRQLYVSIPFALSLRDGRAAGLFWDHPGRQAWDLGETRPDDWCMTADDGVVDLYLFTGPRVPDIVERYTCLTGRLPLPPRWALGYHQSRYSYESGAELEAVAAEFRRRRIPCDALYCDIHHMDGYRVFTFGKTYPRPGEMIGRLARQGFKVVTIVDPGVKDDPRFGLLRRGRQHDAFVKAPGGKKDYLGKVWPGTSRFPDFLNPGVRAWWGEEQRALQDLGVAGFWNDMNEPADTAGPGKTLDPECPHRTPHGPRRHAEVHNVYGQEMARACREGALRHAPDTRPFVISRAGYAGIQRHALVWTGDNSSCWEHLADALQQCLNLGLSGVGFVGADVGGFLDHATPELFLRWLEFAVFTPFLRNHSAEGSRRQEPWAFGPEAEEIARATLGLRYQLLPYLYGLFEKASRDGTPIMRPMLWHYPNDPVAVACPDQFLLGSNLLVAPVLRPGTVARSVYLPLGDWFDFWTGDRHSGGGHITLAAPLARIPVMVRAGTLLPLAPARPHVGPREPATLVLHVWPGDAGHLDWYDDDGRTHAHARGAFQRRSIDWTPTARGGRLTIGAPAGSYAGHTKAWRLILRDIHRPAEVRIDGTRVASEHVPELGLVAVDAPAQAAPVEVRWR